MMARAILAAVGILAGCGGPEHAVPTPAPHSSRPLEGCAPARTPAELFIPDCDRLGR
jgi:hypothetical protein